MGRLRTISESLATKIVEAHVDTDELMYADAIAKALQKQKTELGNLWTAEIQNSGSDAIAGNGGGRIKIIVPAVPDELEYRVEVENRRTPQPILDDEGNIITEGVPEDIADIKVSVSVNDNPIQETVLKDQPMAGLIEAVTGYVVSVMTEYKQKQQ